MIERVEAACARKFGGKQLSLELFILQRSALQRTASCYTLHGSVRTTALMTDRPSAACGVLLLWLR